MFAAPTAQNEKAQASGLGIGHNNGTGGLKARYDPGIRDSQNDAGPSALEFIIRGPKPGAVHQAGMGPGRWP